MRKLTVVTVTTEEADSYREDAVAFNSDKEAALFEKAMDLISLSTSSQKWDENKILFDAAKEDFDQKKSIKATELGELQDFFGVRKEDGESEAFFQWLAQAKQAVKEGRLPEEVGGRDWGNYRRMEITPKRASDYLPDPDGEVLKSLAVALANSRETKVERTR